MASSISQKIGVFALQLILLFTGIDPEPSKPKDGEKDHFATYIIRSYVNDLHLL